jgi:hypothetical protein
MKAEHTKYLFETFPFFRYKEWKDDKNAVRYTLMPFGFDCGDGWFTLIKTLCQEIKNIFHNAEMNVKYKDKEAHARGEYPKMEDFAVLQVKEKFGGLRFYTGGIPVEVAEKVHAAIRMAKSMSYVICEQCGNAGELRDDRPWVLTLCDKCNEEERHPVNETMNTTALKMMTEGV